MKTATKTQIEINRMTKQKKLILDILRSTTTHPTADWIHLQATKEIDNISRSTVYRNLSILEENRLVLKLNIGNGETRYDGFAHDHIHLVCDKCGVVIDLPEEKMRINKSRISKNTGYKINSVDLILHGLCPECLREEG